MKRALLWLFLVALWALPARAHDLSIDQLLLLVEPGSDTLRGEVSFDPRLTRDDTRKPGPEAERRVLEFLRDNLTLEVDGRPLEPSYSVRELWEPAGATVGDIVTFRAPLPESAQAVSVAITPRFRALALTIQTGDPKGEVTTHSTLVLGGRRSPPIPLGGPPGEGFFPGGISEMLPDAGVPLHGPTSARPAPAPRSAPAPAPAPDGWLSAALAYVAFGFRHILPEGLDHILFVTGLLLGATRLRRLILELTAFTAAHTVTLALATFGVVSLPTRLVETTIALSIAYVAIENLLRSEPSRARLLLVLGFGLIHGLGFARALSHAGLSGAALGVGLVGFNLGVELGQLTVVGILLFASLAFRDRAALRRWVARPGSVAIGGVGLFWAAQRLFAS